jgi:hypothetical protein
MDRLRKVSSQKTSFKHLPTDIPLVVITVSRLYNNPIFVHIFSGLIFGN